jgi:hypothetical protein
MAANRSSQDLQKISVSLNQLSDDVKMQFLEEQLKILNNAPQDQSLTTANQVQPSQRAIDLAWRLIVAAVVLAKKA